jgi:hypothetical protein
MSGLWVFPIGLVTPGDPTARAGSPRDHGLCGYGIIERTHPVETEKLPCNSGVPLAGVFTSSRSPEANATLPDPVPVVFPAAM